ncbi:tRNA (cytosine-5-)-methyltransferase ncl1 [Massospora cicadina]|nr:tRNA (cytosine-5-)-methyltransferase ncl1 [Massospora cicadina]
MVVKVTPLDMKVLLEQATPFIKDLTPGVQEKLLPLEQGTVVITFDPGCLASESAEGSEGQPKVLISPESASRMVYPLWKANVSVNLLLAKQEQSSLLHRLFGSEDN